MKTDSFHAGGRTAWWQGLRAAVRNAEERIEQATTDEARAAAQDELDRLKRDEQDAKQNGRRWLF